MIKTKEVDAACEEFITGITLLMREQNIESHDVISLFEPRDELGFEVRARFIGQVIKKTQRTEIDGTPLELYARFLDLMSNEVEATEIIDSLLMRLITDLKAKEGRDDSRTTFHRLCS